MIAVIKEREIMRILVVEDEPKIARSLAKGLEAEGYIVDTAEDGDQAAIIGNTMEYDAVVLDWMIPGAYDGPGLIKLWREQGNQAPILMLTARGSIGDRVTGLDAGADDYLPKPFSFDELLARVRALLRRPKEHNGIHLESGPVSLDIVTKAVVMEGEPVHLTAKEYHLMEYLLRRQGQVVSKDDLLDHVWSDEDRVQHNTVETFIANLRKKIGPGERVIKTVRGHGYKVA